jgi:hypothetical protein
MAPLGLLRFDGANHTDRRRTRRWHYRRGAHVNVTKHKPTLLLAALCAAPILSGCVGRDDPAASAAVEQPAGITDQGAVRVEDAAPAAETESPVPASVTPTAPGSPAPGGVAELPNRGWAVGNAGTVRFSVQNGGLVLDGVSPRSGWSEWVEDRGPEDIEVAFFRDNVEWRFVAELEFNGVKVETRQTTTGAQPGTYRVADVGEVEFRVDGGALTLVDVREQAGSTARVDEHDLDEIDVEFYGDNSRHRFAVDLDDGRIEVVVDQEAFARP